MKRVKYYLSPSVISNFKFRDSPDSSKQALSNNKPMKIAQIAPLFESVPPKFYGGTERVVSYLTEELVRQGHDVTLFASGDSVSEASLVPCCETALRLNRAVRDWLPHHTMLLEEV